MEKQMIKFNIQNYIQEKGFRVAKPGVTLFPPTEEDLVKYLREKKCPVCARKLYPNLDGSKWFCKSKFKDRFFIRGEVLEKFL